MVDSLYLGYLTVGVTLCLLCLLFLPALISMSRPRVVTTAIGGPAVGVDVDVTWGRTNRLHVRWGIRTTGLLCAEAHADMPGSVSDAPVGNLPPKKILKSSSGDMSASKSR